MKLKVLVIAADFTLRGDVARILQSDGYLVELAASEKRTRKLLEDTEIYAAIVAPASLGADGLKLLNQAKSAIRRVIALAEDDREAGRLAGSHSDVAVLPQPLDRTDLLHCLSAPLKVPAGDRADPETPEPLSFDGRTVDFAGRAFYASDGSPVYASDGSPVKLTWSEFELLTTFVQKPGRVLSRGQLRNAVPGRSGGSYEPFDRAIDNLVKRLRSKIEPVPNEPRYILTVLGVGYKFDPRPAEPPPTQAAPGRQQPEKRQMTVLSCQLSGFAALAATRDPEDVLLATSRTHQEIEDVVRPFDGWVTKPPGDGWLVYFGYPEAHEGDVVRAVSAALRLVRSVPTADVGLPARRVCIATGVMLVAGKDMPPIGEQLNLALDLRSAARVNGVVIAASTKKLIGEFFDCEELASIALERETVPAWRVVGERAVKGRFDALHRTDMLELVDRKEQLKQLQGRWQEAKRGSGKVVMLTGEPGIGKSRLLAALEQYVSAESHVCLKYFGVPHQTDASMFAIISELHGASGFEHDDPASVNLAKLEATLSNAQLSPSERREEAFAVLLKRIKALAASRPVLIIVEDIQWIDPASRDFLALVVEQVLALPVLMLIAARPEYDPPWLGFAHVTLSKLQPLTRSDAELLLERVAKGKSLPRDVDVILDPADGVPLFIEELTKTALETGSQRNGKEHHEVDYGHVRVIPSKLHESLLPRLDRLGPDRKVAQIGAVIGREFSYGLLHAVANMPKPELNEALKRIDESGLIYGLGEPPRATYMFKHALVRDAAYGMLPRALRSEFHGAIARALEQNSPETVRAQPELLAHHYLEAGNIENIKNTENIENIEKAVHYLSDAGERALSRSALTEAKEQITKALQLIATLPENDSRRRKELKLQVDLARTLLEQNGYADKEVGKAYAKAAEWSKRVDYPRMQIAVHYGLWGHLYVSGQPKAMLKQANEFLALARRQNEIDPSEIGPLMTGHRLVGTAHLINGEVKKAIPQLNKALSHFSLEEHGPASKVGQDLRARFGQDVGATVHAYRSWALWLSGWPDQAADAAAKTEARGRAADHRHSLFYALWHAGMARVMLRDEAEVARLGSELTEYANERDLPYWQALGHFLQAWQVLQAWHARQSGQPADAIERLELGLELWEQRGSRVFRPVCLAFLADAYAADQKSELARSTFDKALQTAADTGERWAEPEIHRLYGNFLAHDKDSPPSAAIAHYERAIEIAKQQGSRSLELRATMSLARIASAQGGSIEWHERLSKIYRTFKEGSGTKDLKDARALLEAGAVR